MSAQAGVPTVVVGVDGSVGGQAALRFAAQEAGLRGATLRTVMAWQPDTMAYSAGPWGPMVDPTDVEEGARTALDVAVDKIDGGAVPIERVLAMGSAARVLIEQAEGAELLVVGSRGHGGFAGLLLGSVGQQCAQHAPCPVAIVRGSAEDT